MDSKRLQFRRYPVCTALAVVTAGLYLATVFGAYLAAESAHDALGYAYAPFLFLSQPWSEVVYPIVSLMPNHDVAHATLDIACLALSGINASILFFLVQLASSGISDRILGPAVFGGWGVDRNLKGWKKSRNRRLAEDFISSAATREAARRRLPCWPRQRENRVFRQRNPDPSPHPIVPVLGHAYTKEFAPCRHISRRPSIAFHIVTSSANSMSLPTGMPIAMRETFTPSGFSSFDK